MISLPLIDSIENHTFLRGPLAAGGNVLDLGANRGNFGREVTRRYPVTCYGIEPNPELYSRLQSNDRLQFYNFAVSGQEGEAKFNISGTITASSLKALASDPTVATATVTTRTLAGFLEELSLSRVTLMKVDIEGSEVELFGTTPDSILERIDQITIEFHTVHKLMTEAQFRTIHDRLRRLGFCGIAFGGANTNWLYFRPERVGVGRLQDAYLRYVVRNVRGVGRKLGYRPT